MGDRWVKHVVSLAPACQCIHCSHPGSAPCLLSLDRTCTGLRSGSHRTDCTAATPGTAAAGRSALHSGAATRPQLCLRSAPAATQFSLQHNYPIYILYPPIHRFMQTRKGKTVFLSNLLYGRSDSFIFILTDPRERSIS